MGDGCRHRSPPGYFYILLLPSPTIAFQWTWATPSTSLMSRLCLLPFSRCRQPLLVPRSLFCDCHLHHSSFQGSKVFLSIFFSLLCKQGSLVGDQTPFFLHLFSSRPPGNYAFLLRPLEGENFLKHVLQTPLMDFFSNFLFWGFFKGTFSEGETCPHQLCYLCILHLWANAACLFSRERETTSCL
ncbi:unnamed protein product [Acanthosepion pharaonis]|uniref:Uncharacterized protein n=1 Tax=Acanthosepion pharaonis TaxID=158019 RepID=A0A812CY45_ACAPH|nr:unnamed protein product [Sepia pharaonis]